MNWSSWTLIYRPTVPRVGHKLFLNFHTRVFSLCDWLGATPDLTDDGPLVLTPGLSITLALHKGGLVFIVPVNNGDSAVWTDIETGRAIKVHLNAQVTFDQQLIDLLDSVKEFRS